MAGRVWQKSVRPQQEKDVPSPPATETACLQSLWTLWELHVLNIRFFTGAAAAQPADDTQSVT